MNGSTVLAAAVCGFLLTAAATLVLRRVALRWGIVDRPGGHKSHRRPTPYLGGVAIALGTLLPPIALAGPAVRPVAGILVGALAMALLGLIDDLIPLPPLTRLAVQALAAGVVVVSGVVAPLTGTWLDLLVTLVWIAVVTNSFNLLDNMDGALGAVAVGSAAILAAAAFVSGQPVLGLLLTALLLSVLGFLPFNWAPAKIFMGDAGSLFIGFVLASSAALLVTGRGPGTAIAGLLLPTFVATVDTGVVVLSRTRAGRSIMQGGTDHLSHRLHKLGLSKRLTALALAVLAAVTGVLDLLMTLRWISPLSASLIGLVAASVLIGLPQRVRVYPPLRAQSSHLARRK
ncbi:glycosyltransferase family 4 protein [Microbispora sp. NPDC004025]